MVVRRGIPLPEQKPPMEEIAEDPVDIPYEYSIIIRQELIAHLTGKLSFCFIYLWACKAR